MGSEVILDSALASDLAVVNAARVSFNQESDKMGAREEGLINFLISNGHGTPFEHGVFRFNVKVPIFVAREWFRHRVSSFNEWSGRYSEIDTEFFRPKEVRTQVGKPGAYSFEPHPGAQGAADEIFSEVEDACRRGYLELLSLGVAKEQARIVLPVSTFTRFIWTVNPRSLMNFLMLRTSEHAMKEIRECALEVEKAFAEHMPVTHQAWLNADRRAP